ncbi:MAG: beta-galactosidase trimerization domain-containing protein, partial [Spirochaetales bacterium]|nr:beta-galactosidase trimerization domain-containing protein [Spirochaetales bacterium]
YVAAGGTFVATYLSGLVDDSDLCFPGGAPGPLSDLLGIWVEDTDIPTEYHTQHFSWQGSDFTVFDYADKVHCTTAEVLSVFNDGFLHSCPALTANAHGHGFAWYLAARTEDPFLYRLYSVLSDKCNINRYLSSELPEGVTVQYRFSGNTEFSFWMNFSASEKKLALSAVTLYDMLSETKISREIVIPPYGVRVFKRDVQIS